MYVVDSSTSGGATPGLYTCINPGICTVGTNPIGFLEVPSSPTSGTMKIFCSFHGTNGFSDACTSRSMSDDTYTNMCIRGYEFQEPNQKEPNVCPIIPDVNYRRYPYTFSDSVKTRQTVIYGDAKTIADVVQPSAPGYKGEAVVNELGADYKVSQSIGLYDASRVYHYNDIIASYANTASNEPIYYGPFFRCIVEGSGVAPPSAPKTAYKYSHPSEGVLTNTHWTNQNIPSVWKNNVTRHAGHGGNLVDLCVWPSTPGIGTPTFCPNVCATQCPLGDPNTQVGLHEPGYTYDPISKRVTESSCWPRCGPSDIFQGSGEVCQLKHYGTDKVAAYSLCANGQAPVVQLNDKQLHNGHSSQTSTTLSVTTGQCYGSCPVNMAIVSVDHTDPPPQDNFTQCIDVCPQSESFYDSEGKCMKIAAQRATQPSAGTSNSITNALTTNVSTSAKISKFALYGGTSSLWTFVGVVVGIGILTALILLARRRQVVKSSQYFRAT
jgi:hypothetical protein